MAAPADPVPGFSASVHCTLIEPILLAGAARGRHRQRHARRGDRTGLRVWIAGILNWLDGHLAAVCAPR